MRVVRHPVVYVGIDASSKMLAAVAMCMYHGELSLAGVRSDLLHRSSESFSPADCGRGYDRLTEFLSELSGVDRRVRFRVVIERPIVYPGGRGVASLVQSFVSGAFQAAAANFPRTSVSFTSPSEWKKAVLGKGNLDKPGVSAAVRLRWPDDFDHVCGSQDTIDAYCIARHAHIQFPHRPVVA